MRELTLEEVESVSGGVDQSTSIGGNIAIALAGMGLEQAAVALGLTISPLGMVVVGGLILTSLALTLSYIWDQL